MVQEVSYGPKFKLWAEPRLARSALLRLLIGRILMYSGCGMGHIFSINFSNAFYKVIFMALNYLIFFQRNFLGTEIIVNLGIKISVQF